MVQSYEETGALEMRVGCKCDNEEKRGGRPLDVKEEL